MDTLKIEHLKKIYKGRAVVKDVSFFINSAEIVGLLGPNGAGKTTSFYMTLGVINQDGGKIFLNDKDISNFTVHERAHLGIGYLPQEPSIFRKLTVAENIMAVLELRKNLTDDQRQTICDNLLDEFHISALRDNMGFSLSGGERRRVEIARALALEPKFILLDEPFAGIDPISVIDIKHIIYQLHQRQIGVLITDHNVRETLDICHRAYIVNAGEIIAAGAPKEILQNDEVRKVYLGEHFAIN
jgi:lipopolysaccharide export system ATP-binding protein